MFTVPVPTITGALVIKSRAAALAPARDKHLEDIARLLAAVPDPETVRAELTRSDRGALRAVRALLSDRHPAWRGVAGAEDGIIVLAHLIA